MTRKINRTAELLEVRKEYTTIVRNARLQGRKKRRASDPDYAYYEAHHVLPASLFPLWKKRKSNVVLLLPREHFRCHELLKTIYPSYQMTYALHMLAHDGQNNPALSATEYERLQKEFRALQRERMSGKGNPMYGTSRVAWNKGKPGRKATPEEREARSKRSKGKIGLWNKGKKRTIETKKKLGERAYERGFNKQALGAHWWTNGSRDVLRKQCPPGFRKGRSKGNV